VTALRAVIFDVGGVLTSSPVVAIREYLAAEGLDYGVLGPMLGHPEMAWSRWERNAIATDEFIAQFEAEARAEGITVSGRGVITAAFSGMAAREDMVDVVRQLRGTVRLGCITNNVARHGVEERPRPFVLSKLFEVVIESSKVGLRKPDPRIFQMACEALGVAPEETAFLDDLGANLKGARALGMTTIRVDHTWSAVEELSAALGLTLTRLAAGA
jgi:putative hydrolase of the HAD superfamily